MSELLPLRIGGVPEYFNLPIHLAIEEGHFKAAGIDLQWQDVPEGTGKMVKALEQNELDLAVPLTEGMVKSLAMGNPAKIVHIYVQSPLHWGIHVPAKSSYQHIDELKGKVFAISRYGSGSHLMATLLVQRQSWNQQEANFEVVNHLDGARRALAQGSAEVFMWEKYTTQFLVDNGEFRRIDTFPTPWPCFVVAATDQILTQQPALVHTFLEQLTAAAARFNRRPDRQELITDRYALHRSDVMHFLPDTRWNTEILPADEMVDRVRSTLQAVGQLTG